jgi:hypothetical protein
MNEFPFTKSEVSCRNWIRVSGRCRIVWNRAGRACRLNVGLSPNQGRHRDAEIRRRLKASLNRKLSSYSEGWINSSRSEGIPMIEVEEPGFCLAN